MPNEVNGLPAHVLLVHVVVALVPLTSLLLLLAVFWSHARRRIGIVLPLLGLVTLVSVPVTTHAGEWLEAHVGHDPLVERHAELGDQMLPWALGLFVMSVAVWVLHRRAERAGATAPAGTPVALRAVLGVLAVVVAAGSVVTVYRIGDSGARAAWHDTVTSSSHR